MDIANSSTTIKTSESPPPRDWFQDFGMDLLGQASPPKLVKKIETDLMELDTTTPLVSFSVIPGHHGGMISNLRMHLSNIVVHDKFILSCSGNKGWKDYVATNMCIVYETI